MEPSNRTLASYLAAIGLLGASVVGLLGFLFYTRVPDSPEQLATYSLLDDGIAVLLVFAALAVTVLLVGLIVGFGARYGLAAPDELETE